MGIKKTNHERVKELVEKPNELWKERRIRKRKSVELVESLKESELVELFSEICNQDMMTALREILVLSSGCRSLVYNKKLTKEESPVIYSLCFFTFPYDECMMFGIPEKLWKDDAEKFFEHIRKRAKEGHVIDRDDADIEDLMKRFYEIKEDLLSQGYQMINEMGY